MTTQTEPTKIYCDRKFSLYDVTPWTEARLTNFFNLVDDGEDVKRAVNGLKTWKGSQSYRLTMSDKASIDYVIECYG
jgi:hypothetical protein